MSKRSENVKEWRKNTKIKMVQSMGGCCQSCGYVKCNEALELHHIDPTEKEFGFGKIIGNPTKWERIVDELKKCILLCANCHREVHFGSREIPKNFQKYDEKLIFEKNRKNMKLNVDMLAK